MAARKKKPKAPVVEPSDSELATLVKDAVSVNSGVTATSLKKALAKFPPSVRSRALDVARTLTTRGELVRWAKGTKECFFDKEPVEALERLVLEALDAGPLLESELKKRIVLLCPAHAELLAEWKKGALARRVVFAHPAKRLGKTPDVRAALAKPLAELEKALDKLQQLGVSRCDALAVLLEVLQVAANPRPADAPQTKLAFLNALGQLASESPPGTLLSIRELRARAGLDKGIFDGLVLALATEGKVTLHYHDYPDSLTAAERDQLVKDARGTVYVGIAPRGGR